MKRPILIATSILATAAVSFGFGVYVCGTGVSRLTREANSGHVRIYLNLLESVHEQDDERATFMLESCLLSSLASTSETPWNALGNSTRADLKRAKRYLTDHKVMQRTGDPSPFNQVLERIPDI